MRDNGFEGIALELHQAQVKHLENISNSLSRIAFALETGSGIQTKHTFTEEY